MVSRTSFFSAQNSPDIPFGLPYLAPLKDGDGPPELIVPGKNSSSWSSWKDIIAGMQDSPSCALGQNWRNELEPSFLSSQISVAHNGTDLIVYGELLDLMPHNPMRRLNEEAYVRGDVFEIFLRSERHEHYFEFHLTPENHQLQILFPDRNALANVKAGSVPINALKAAFPIPTFTAMVPSAPGWRLVVFLPLEILSNNIQEILGHALYFSFCRYDYVTAGQPPVLSSSSPHPFPDFHRQEDWGKLILQ